MKLASRLQGRQHPQIWNSAPQLADIPIISTQTLIPAGAVPSSSPRTLAMKSAPVAGCSNC